MAESGDMRENQENVSYCQTKAKKDAKLMMI